MVYCLHHKNLHLLPVGWTIVSLGITLVCTSKKHSQFVFIDLMVKNIPNIILHDVTSFLTTQRVGPWNETTANSTGENAQKQFTLHFNAQTTL